MRLLSMLDVQWVRWLRSFAWTISACPICGAAIVQDGTGLNRIEQHRNWHSDYIGEQES